MLTREFCKLWEAKNSALWEIHQTIKNISDKISEIIALKNSIKYGLINLGDIAVSELLATVKNMAARVADALIGQASSLAAAAIQAILQPLIRILLFSPNALFALIAIPHERALDSANKERIELKKIESNINIIVYIMNKWLGDNNHPGYREQITQAIPLVEDCVKILNELINDLNNSGNAFFSESKYNQLQRTLDNAIKITETSSNIERVLGIKTQQRASANQIYSKKVKSITANYRREKLKLNTWYKKNMITASKKEINPGEAVNETMIKEEYNYRLTQIEFEYKSEKAKANIESEAEALISVNTYVKSFLSTKDEFKNDLSILNGALRDMLGAFKKALKYYLRSYRSSDTVVNSASLIKKMISWLISILQLAGNGGAKALLKALEASLSNIEVSESVLKKSLSKSSVLSRTSDLTALISANSLLKTSDAILEATVVSSLIDLINSDEKLGASNEQFEAFVSRMHLIPDWKVKDLSWLSSKGSISPYPDLILTVATLIIRLPIKLTKRDDSIKDDILDVRRKIDQLERHSVTVTKTLKTFTPYQTPEGAQLRQVLSRMGLLSEFAIGFNIASALFKAIKGFVNDGWEIPSSINCRAMFPDTETEEGSIKGEMQNDMLMSTFPDLVLFDDDFADDNNILPDKANIDFKNPLDNFVDLIPESESRYN